MKNSYEIRGDVTAIFLTSKKHGDMETLIDTADLDKAKEFPMTWYANWSNFTKSFYVVGNTKIENGKRKSVKLHRWIYKNLQDKVIDHINHDTLDNRKINTRQATHSENRQNRKGATVRNKCGVRNVMMDKRSGKWKVVAVIDKKLKCFGFFEELSAAEARSKEIRTKYMLYSLESMEQRGIV